VRKKYFYLFILPLMFWPFFSCASSENMIETTTQTTQTTQPKVEKSEFPNGWIQIGTDTFRLVFKCYKNQLGEPVAIGTTTDSSTGESVEALIQVFEGKPYVGVLKNGSTMFESSLNETLDISVDGYEIKSDVITWQKDIDLQSAYGESVGFGSLFVQCEKFEADLLEEKMNN